MPELPAMQALAERLDARLAGAVLAGIQPLQFFALKTVSPDPLSLVGRTLDKVGRKGKYLVLTFGGPRILIHLSQGGRVDVEDPPKQTRPRGATVRLAFGARGSFLVKEHGTERKAAWWVLDPGEEGPLAGLGPEPGTTEFSELVLGSTDRRRIHTLLRDQHTVSGVGRGYADDALHRAGLSPYATLASLTAEQRQSLLAAIETVLAGGLAAERRRTGGLPPKLGDHWVVHRKWGQPCPWCGTVLARVSYESHEVTYCPACQTGGKVLADRRLSRLLK